MEHLPETRARALAQAIAHTFATEVEHLESCTSCRARVFHLVLRANSLEYRHALARSVDETLHQLARVAEEKSVAPALLADLLALPSTERDVAVAADSRFQTYALAAYTLERCEKAIPYDPAIARMLARLAGRIASRTDPRTCGGSAALLDLEAYALAMEGNALRVSGALPAALESFTLARQLLEESGADPDLGARIDSLESSLHRDLRQFDEALSLLDRAVKSFLRLKETDQAVRMMVNRANVFTVQGDLDKAVGLLEEAHALSADPTLTLSIRHNLLNLLLKLGQPREAHQLFEQTLGLYLQHTDPHMTARRLWIEGLILRELGKDLELAAGLLAEAAAHLADHGYAFDAALAGLDLATVYALQGDSAEVLRIAGDLVRMFRVRNLHPEALAALTLVHQAAQQEAVSLTLLAQAAEKVRCTGQSRGASEG